MTTKDNIDFKELEDYRPWTLDEVPVGGILGIWGMSHEQEWVFIGKCLIIGARQVYNDIDDFLISLGSNSRWGNGVKEENQRNLLYEVEFIKYRVYNPLACFDTKKENGVDNEWLPCGVKKVKEIGITVGPDKKSKKSKKSKNKVYNGAGLYIPDNRCECKKNCWCSADLRVDCLTGHSSTCPNVTTRLMMDKTQELLKELTTGIEAWAADEDGVHPEIWKAYVKAKTIIGEAHTLGKEC